MSIPSEIERIKVAKSNIASAIESKGVDVPVGTSLSSMAPLIMQISSEGSSSGGASFNYRTNSYTITSNYDMSWGSRKLITATAFGSVTVVIKAEFEAKSDCDGNVNILVNELKAGQSRFIANAGDTTEVTTYCSVYISGTADIAISSDCDCALKKCQVFVVGGGAFLDVPGGQIAFVKKDTNWVAFNIVDGNAQMYIFNEDTLEITEQYNVGKNATNVDVTVLDTKYVVFNYTDNAGNVFVRMMANNMSGVFTSCVETNATYSTITTYEDDIIVATVVDGNLTYRKIDSTGAFSAPMTLINTGNVQEAYFIKDAPRPMLVVKEQDKAYLYRSEEEHKGSDVIDLALIIAFGS